MEQEVADKMEQEAEQWLIGNQDRTSQFYEKLGYTNLGAVCRKRIGGK